MLREQLGHLCVSSLEEAASSTAPRQARIVLGILLLPTKGSREGPQPMSCSSLPLTSDRELQNFGCTLGAEQGTGPGSRKCIISGPGWEQQKAKRIYGGEGRAAQAPAHPPRIQHHPRGWVTGSRPLGFTAPRRFTALRPFSPPSPPFISQRGQSGAGVSWGGHMCDHSGLVESCSQRR